MTISKAIAFGEHPWFKRGYAFMSLVCLSVRLKS